MLRHGAVLLGGLRRGHCARRVATNFIGRAGFSPPPDQCRLTDAAIEQPRARFSGAVSRLPSRWLAQFALARFARRAVP